MIDILGGILGHKASKPGAGSDILKEMFGRERQASPRKTSEIPTESEIERKSRELEDMLNVANERQSTGRSAPAPRSAPSSSYPTTHRDHPSSSSDARSSSRSPAPSGGSSSQSGDRALVLIRAMVNAAKADGKVDEAEQQNILKRLSDQSPDAINFLRSEFARPLDVQEFAKSVPLGMEEQVYMLSLITIDLDTSGEAQYLTELSDSLRISPETRNQIHQRVGAPSLY